ncbi:MAG TPA: response regulator transcription factor [Xanthobacteraceae bacterium]|jgi:two-component system invasion response regulator UvrY|nr:response regulator transcription factor [Xanthobacteraceae bacterium]
MTSVLIIDDHPIVLQGCRRVLADAGMEPVLTASDLVAGYRLYRRHQPDVIVVDLAIRGKGLGGLDLIRRIRTHNPRARVLVLSMHNDAMIVARSLEAGATGYVLKDTSSEQLVKAVQQIANGAPYLDGELAVKVALVGSRAVRSNPLSDLTPRELQVLALLADGKPYNRIADELNVSYKTVVNVSSQLKQKLEARNLPELVSAAVKLLAAPP